MESTAGETMLSWLPPTFRDNTTFSAILDAWGIEVDKIQAAADELVAAMTINDNTPDWALDIYERELGYPTDPTVSPEDRRARIRAFSRRGSRTATAANIEDLIAQFTAGSVSVTQAPDTLPNTIDIEFVDTHGIPPDLEFIEAFLRRIVPAHLDITFNSNFFMWSELRALNITWGQLRSSGVTWKELGETGPDIDGDNAKMQASKTHTFSNAAGLGAVGGVPLLEVTGRILLEAITIKCTTDLVSGGGGSIQFFADEVGASGPATTPTDLGSGAILATSIDATEFHIAAPDLHILMDEGGGGIYGTVTGSAITGGVIVVEAVYRRISSDGLLAEV